MKISRYFAAMLAASILPLCAVLLLAAAQYAPPPPVKPSEEVLKKIEELKEKLDAELKLLRRLGIQDPFLADIEVYLKAATWITQHNEFYDKDSGQWTIEALERGLLRT